MIFDYKAYSRLLNEFIIEGEKIEQYRDPAFNKILDNQKRSAHIL